MLTLRSSILFFFFFLTVSICFGQKDTLFWFVAPDLEQSGTSQDYDQPTYFKFSTYGQAATINVSQPANSGFPVQTFNVAANSTYVFNLSAYLSDVENQPANQVLTKGFQITSTTPISAVYEVTGECNCNTEIFTLKGLNALGNNFYVPFQNLFESGNFTLPNARSGFDIVATLNNTTVTITPTTNITGHTAGTAFSITLQKGETWSGRASGVTGAAHPAGTKITSNKPIAVTMKDDLVKAAPLISGGCLDLIGDQIVPVNELGKDFAIIPGEIDGGSDRIFILASENNTEVKLDGVVITTIATAGQQYATTYTNSFHYLETSKPVYVLILTGIGCELTSALVPPLTCHGGQNYRFVRETFEEFWVYLVVPTGSEDAFSTTNFSFPILASDFSNLPGNSAYKVFKKSATSGQITVDVSGTINNSESRFHMAFLHGSPNTNGSKMAFFADYSDTIAEVFLPLNAQTCDYPIAITSPYSTTNWSNGQSGVSVQLSGPGTITAVAIDEDGCFIKDSYTVTSAGNSSENFIQTSNSPCNYPVQLSSPYVQTTWSNGSTGVSTSINGPGIITATAINNLGCTVFDTISVSIDTVVQNFLSLSNDPCGYPVNLLSQFANTTWSNGQVGINASVNSPQTISAFGVNTQGCLVKDTITVFVDTLVENFLSLSPTACSYPAGVISPYVSTFWNNGSVGVSTTVNAPSTLSAVATNDIGCIVKDTIFAQVDTVFQEFLLATSDSCAFPVIVTSLYPTTFWSNGLTGTSITLNANGFISAFAIDNNGCYKEDQLYINVDTLDENFLQVDEPVCNYPVVVNSGLPDILLWSNGASTPSVTLIGPSTVSALALNAQGCIVTDTITVYVDTLQEDFIIADTLICSFPTLLSSQYDVIQWSNGSSAQTTQYTGTSAISALAVNDDGCLVADEILLTLDTLYDDYLLVDTGLCNFPVTITSPYNVISWSDGSSDSSIDVTQPGFYSVYATDENGCVIFDDILISIDTAFETFLPEDTTFCNQPIEIISPYMSTNWSTGQTNTNAIFSDVIGTIIAFATNDEGCLVVDEINISQFCPPDSLEFCEVFMIPNVFSPNGDGINDTWKVTTNENCKLIKTQIFDRWGNLIFETNDFNVGWDGTFRGQDQTSDVVVWQVFITDLITGKEIFKSGDLLLLR